MKKKRFLLWSHIHTKRKTTKKIHSKRKILEQLIQRELHVRADQEWDWFWCFNYWYSISEILGYQTGAPGHWNPAKQKVGASVLTVLPRWSNILTTRVQCAPHFITDRSVFIVHSIFNILSGFTVWPKYDETSTERNSYELMRIFHSRFHHTLVRVYNLHAINYRISGIFSKFLIEFWINPYIYPRYYFYWIPSRFHPNLTPNELLKIVFLQH